MAKTYVTIRRLLIIHKTLLLVMAAYNSRNTHLCSPEQLLFFLFMFYMSFLSVFSFVSPLSFNFDSFNPNNHEINYEGDAYPAAGAIQLTLNECDKDMSGKTGRATYTESLHLWDNASGNLADFTTHFSFVISTANISSPITGGDGLAFFLVPNGSHIPPNTEGGGLGLGHSLASNNQTTNSTGPPFVAVEFDTFVNQWDSDTGAHIGIDINSVSSVATLPASIHAGKKVDSWISYDAKLNNLSVLFKGYKAELDGIYYIINLRKYLPEWVTFGFSATTGASTEIHSICSWYFNSSLQTIGYDRNNHTDPIAAMTKHTPPSRVGTNKIVEVVGLTFGATVVIFGFVLSSVYLWKTRVKRGKGNGGNHPAFNAALDDEFEKGMGSKKFPYHELVRSTKNFTEEEKLGEGGFGGVYRGFLRDWNSFVAIKRISRESRQGIKEYASEVKIISRLRHRNLVQLLGWCHDKELLLVYEFMPNGSLDSLLFREENVLSWTVRYRIAQGLASALLYLHEEWEQCVIHRDVKSSNVMLDLSFNARLRDFGLARLVDHEKGPQTTDLAGTMGYMAPECVTSGKASRESDVYSFGIVALEIACGRKPIDPNAKESQIVLVEWVWELYGVGQILEAADPKLCAEFDNREMGRLMIVGLWCAHPDFSKRPSIRQAIHVLTFEAPVPILPSKMPVPTYFAPPLNMLSSSLNPLHATALSFNLTNIGPQLNAEIVAERDAYVSPEATYKDPLFLWDNTSGKLTDFNTYFSFVIDSKGSNVYGDGITFFLVPNGSTPNITAGGAIGLPFDLQTLSTTPLLLWSLIPIRIGVGTQKTPHINIPSGIENEALINYDFSSKNLSVVFTNSINNMTVERNLCFLVDLREYLPEWVAIGLSDSTGMNFEKNTVKSWTLNLTLQIDVPLKPGPSPGPNTAIPSPPKKMGENNKKALVVGLTAVSPVLIGGLALLGFVLWKKSSRVKEEDGDEFAIELSMDNEFEAGIEPKKFTYGELFRAIDNFAEEHTLGEGGFGGVYRGFLRESNSYVAMKRISKGSKQGIKEYASEVEIISRLRHINLVQLIGWCHDKRELLLVCEFMENRSLDYHLFKEKALLTWVIRYKIAQGLVLACSICTKNGNNVWYFLTTKGSQKTVLAGTMGYVAPGCLITGKANKESDVYSFGIVALEIACGRKPIDLKAKESKIRIVDWVWDLYGTSRLLEAVVDSKICPDFVQKEMECLMIVGLWCAHPDHNLRPSIRQAIHVLNFEAPLPILPIKMHVATYFAPMNTSSSLVSLTYGSTTVSNSSQVHSSSYTYDTDFSKYTSSSATSSSASSSIQK
ncbi:unnamed protein product [Camellia sinensis]